MADSFLSQLAEALTPREQRVVLADLKIRTKDKRVVTFEPNAVQRHYLDTLCPDWRRGGVGLRGVREVLLKARQFGFSTLILALFFLDTINTPNTATVVIAHDTESTERLFQIVHRFYELLPDEKKPRTKYANRREMVWPDLGSSFFIGTAGSKGFGRGSTINNLHMSEVAFWENPDALLTGLLQAVPEGGNIFEETTANGEGNQYYHDYQAAKSGDSTFTARFFAWWQHEEYQTPPDAGFAPTEDERALAARCGLTDAQLLWRRNKVREPGMGSLFAQEYPSDDREAFLVSGSKYFTEWDEARHCRYPGDVSVERHWTYFGGFDWGYGAPYCFLLAAVNERGQVLIIDELYRARELNGDQAAAVVAALSKWNLKPADVTVYADPSMWAKKVQGDGVGRADVEDFWKAGLRFVKANNNRQHGWTNFRQYLHDEGALTVLRGNCPNLIRTVPIQVHDRANVEDLDTDLEDHAADAARYLLNSRPRPSRADPAQPPRRPKLPDDFTEDVTRYL